MSKEHRVSIKSVTHFGGNVTLSMRAYFSTYHFWAARHFLKLATQIEENGQDKPVFNIEHRAYIHNSILSSVAFLEATINELFQDAHDEHQSYINDLDQTIINKLSNHWKETELERNYETTLIKYQRALSIAGKEPMNEGVNPYQNTKFVIELRNFLTHYKPKNIGGDETHSLEGKLKGKFPLNKKYEKSGNEDFPDKMLSAGCAKWSFDSVKSLADEFFAKMNIEPNYQKVDFDKLAGKS